MKWMIAARKADFAAMAEATGHSQILARLMRNRGVMDAEGAVHYLTDGLEGLSDPFAMDDMEKTVEILRDAIARGHRIRIIGDYDVDGICAAYILHRTLRALGGTVDAHLPERIRDGYGLNERLVREAAAEGIDLIITCDNGIAAAKEVALANALGIRVIVTDHHEIPRTEEAEGEASQWVLPPADAVVDPKRSAHPGADPVYPCPQICGAAVCFQLARALLGQPGHPGAVLTEAMEKDLLGFTALATICDVMPLVGENRIFVRHGLPALSESENPGMRALLRATDMEGKRLSSYTAGFVLGPCLNAAGRLASAEQALSLFLAEDVSEEELLRQAGDLKELNDSRKSMTAAALEEAKHQVSAMGELPKVLMVYLPDCHEALAGILAGRLRDLYSRPSIVLTDSDREGEVKGSGRSMEAYPMYDALAGAADLLLKFGGHPLAGGMSLKKENMESFRAKLLEQATMSEADLEEALHIDMELPPAYADRALVEELELLEPTGTGNEEALFAARAMELTGVRVLGKNRNALRLSLRDQAGRYEGILFGEADAELARLSEQLSQPARESLGRMTEQLPGIAPVYIHVVYTPKLHSYRDTESIQLQIRDFRAATPV